MCVPQEKPGSVLSGDLFVSRAPSARGHSPPHQGIISHGLLALATLIGLTGLIVMAGCGSGNSSVGTGSNQHYVSLTWNPSTSVVVGYYVYRGTTPGTLSRLTGMMAGTSYTDYSVANRQTYVYAVTSVDAENVESTFSTPVTVTIPAS